MTRLVAVLRVALEVLALFFLRVGVPDGFDGVVGGFPHLTDDLRNFWVGFAGVLGDYCGVVVLAEEDEG